MMTVESCDISAFDDSIDTKLETLSSKKKTMSSGGDVFSNQNSYHYKTIDTDTVTSLSSGNETFLIVPGQSTPHTSVELDTSREMRLYT